MNRIIITFILLCTGFAVTAQDDKHYTLEEAIAIALANSNEIRTSALAVESAGVAYGQTKLNLFPTINGNISHGMNQGRSIDPFTNSYVNQSITYGNYNLGSTVNVFNGLSLQNTVKQFQYSQEAAKLDQQQLKDNLTLNVILAYLQVLSNEDLVKQAEQQITVTQKQIERLEVLNREGAINPPQLFDMKGQLKENELAKGNAMNSLELSKLTLSQLMNRTYDPAMTLERIPAGEIDARPQSIEQIYLTAAEKLALVRAADMRKRSAAAALKAVKGELYPSVFLSGNVNSNYSSGASRDIFLNSVETPTTDYVIVGGNKTPVITTVNKYNSEKIGYTSQLKNNIFTNIGVGIRIPVFNGLQTRNRIKLAEIELQAQDIIVDETKRQLRQEVEQAFVSMNNAYSRYRMSLEQVAAYAESFRAAEVRYNAGVGTSVDYMIAKNNLDRANLNLIMAKYDYLLRKKVVEFYGVR